MRKAMNRLAWLLATAAGCAALLTLQGDARAAAPAGHFTIGTGAALGTVHDNETSLTWQQGVSPSTQTQAASITYCTSLALAGGGWRLPTVLELRSIVDESVASSGPTIDTVAFLGTAGELFWTSSPVAGWPSFGWLVNFSTGIAGNLDASNNFRARCVR